MTLKIISAFNILLQLLWEEASFPKPIIGALPLDPTGGLLSLRGSG